MTALTDTDGLALLDAATARPQPLLMTTRIDLPRIRAQAGTLPPLWHTLAGPAPRPAASTNAIVEGGSALQQQLAALPPAERERMLTGLVREHAAAVLGHPGPDAVEPGRAFTDLGFDSLTAVELRNRLATATGLHLPATLIFDYPTPTTLATYLRVTVLDEETGSTVVLKELDKLESALAAIAGDDDNRSRLITRLEAVLHDFRAGTPDNVAALQEIDQATDDQIFDLIDRELGT
jgi:polyketide synthase 12